MFWYILLALSILILTWLILAPVIFYVDTEDQRYSLSMPGVFKARLLPSDEILTIKGTIFFIPYRFSPFARKRKKPRTKKEKTTKKKSKLSIRGGWLMGRNVLHAFSIRKLHLNMDSDDFTLNAWLIPAFSALESDNIKLQANFEGHNSVLFDIRTHLGAILWAFIKTKYNLMFNQ